jgi:NAD+ synthase (glutamine-hydrolysing)
MMDLSQLALAQMEVIPGQPEKNLHTALRLLEQARSQGSSLVVFPELCLSGYLIGDLWEEHSFVKDCLAAGEDLIAASQGLCVVFGNVGTDPRACNEDGRLRRYNAAWLATDGMVIPNLHAGLDFIPKTLLPNYREFEETRHFYDLRRLALERKVPLESLYGPHGVNLAGKQVSLGIVLCEDGWGDDYGVHLVPCLVEQGAELVLNLSASPYTRGKNEKRERVFSKLAQQCNVPVGYVNCTGSQNNGKTFFGFDGSSAIYGGDGCVLAASPPWKNGLLTSSTNPIQNANLVEPSSLIASPWASTSEFVPEDHVTLQEVLRRYLTSASIARIVIGVSGGIDSAVSATLFAHICGPENVLLVSMPSEYNTQTTKDLSQLLAKNLGCYFAEVPIGDAVALTKTQIDGLKVTREGAEGSLQEKTLALSAFHLENVQARDRSARVLSALASAFGAVFPCNANKAETTVGYSTLFGDHGGFLAPLADLWKGEIYALGRHLNQSVYGREVIPEGIFQIKPSAELSAAQNPEKGGGDPILYGYHDRLFHAWQQSWNRASPEEILAWYSSGEIEVRLKLSRPISDWFPATEAFIEDLERWWKLFKGMGVVKRVQAPPIVALSRRAFGFDYRESILQPYFSRAYLELKVKLLSD